MSSDITLCYGSEQGVADGMDKDVRIGMALKPEEIRDPYTSQDQGAAGNERMNVISKSNPHRHPLLFIRQLFLPSPGAPV